VTSLRKPDACRTLAARDRFQRQRGMVREGVDGSSPSEGFGFPPAQPAVRLSRLASPGRPRRPRSVHRGRCPHAELVEQTDQMLASVAREVTVMPVDHGQAGTHVAREVEGGDASTEREGREGVPKIVDPARSARSRRHAVRASTRGCGSCAGRGSGLARPGRAAGCADSRAVVRSRRARSLAAALPASSPRSWAFQPTVRERAREVNNARLAIDVAPFERESFGGARPGRGREDHHRPVAMRVIRDDRVDLRRWLWEWV
jgi:hypothetical protein